MEPILRKLSKTLQKTYEVEAFLDNAISIAFNKDDSPFCLIIVEDDSPDIAYLSFAVDAPDPYSIADVTLKSLHTAKVELAEPFFPDPESGDILWGEEAYETYHGILAEKTGTISKEFLDMESPGKLVN